MTKKDFTVPDIDVLQESHTHHVTKCDVLEYSIAEFISHIDDCFASSFNNKALLLRSEFEDSGCLEGLDFGESEVFQISIETEGRGEGEGEESFSRVVEMEVDEEGEIYAAGMVFEGFDFDYRERNEGSGGFLDRIKRWIRKIAKNLCR
ncbi:hypothetical protein RUND412_003525 [Rhizina undulata]